MFEYLVLCLKNAQKIEKATETMKKTASIEYYDKKYILYEDTSTGFDYYVEL